ncbi:PTS system mannose/fructose/sorbose family transporter subunit IID [Anaerocolumna sp. MB42-C2]|uniref:PTS system mannose/fructose/sorbose family transporter subunit IID n=1 Tax=Anaerocolumna sp. MB42-C2 TaxID=3070997 RepID=UPI0027E042F6|nr:PTS system mannose/fructose/sorbose family transporter subunit IID [Anaerocolumna sp. MB42-C2]WMJ89141.1 PTS system mannose/fructose/sorbose family transporter subunit IID [Anaerocolumna sp. MB42-C2]
MKTNSDESTRLLTKKDITNMTLRCCTLDASFNDQGYQNMAFAYTMYPIVRKLYKNQPEKLKRAYNRHLEFFCCNLPLTPFICGIVAAMEEKNSMTEDFDEDTISTVKTALMGPLAGIGDSIFLGTIKIIGTAVGAGLCATGSILGPIVFLLFYNVPAFWARFKGAFKGYELGTDYLDKIQKSGLMEKFMSAAGILGAIVVGGLIFQLIYITFGLTISGSGESAMTLQSLLDNIMPGIAKLGVTGAAFWLIKKKVPVLVIMLITMVLGILAAYTGILVV